MSIGDNEGGYNAVPEISVQEALRIGVEAISADLVNTEPGAGLLIDKILAGIDQDRIDECKTLWGTEPPKILLGYPRRNTVFPCMSIVLSSDSADQDYLGQAEEAWVNEQLANEGDQFHARTSSIFTIYVYTNHPDVCAWYYRIAKHILRVGTRWLIDQGLDDPVLGGADLAPDPRYDPENIFVRRLTVTVQYMENWTSGDALWEAFYGDPVSRATATDVHIYHEDTTVDGRKGGVTPEPE